MGLKILLQEAFVEGLEIFTNDSVKGWDGPKGSRQIASFYRLCRELPCVLSTLTSRDNEGCFSLESAVHCPRDCHPDNSRKTYALLNKESKDSLLLAVSHIFRQSRRSVEQEE